MSDLYLIIFDVCARAAYYKDVHNILALPAEALVRYEYSDYLLENSVRKISSSWQSPKTPQQATKVLLVYAQVEGFQHGDNFDTKVADAALGRLFIPTRWGRLLSLESRNNKHYFSIQLTDYPHIEAAAVSTLVQLLGSTHAVASDKNQRLFVLSSTSGQELERLRGADEPLEKKWFKIISELRAKTQFASDSFWRLGSPINTRTGAGVKPTLANSRFDEHGANLVYEIEHEHELSFAVENHEPRVTQNRTITASSTSESLRVTPTELNLRPYGVTHLRVRGRSEELLKASDYSMELATAPQETDWPIGAAFTVQIRSKRSISELAIGALSGLAGVGAIYWATSFFPDGSVTREKICGTVIFLVGTLLLSFSSYKLYRQLKFEF